MGITRFRAYQLGEAGSSFSYCHDGHITLIEARLTDYSIGNVLDEIKSFGNDILNCLHITSWDQDHCNPKELELLLDYLKPKRIQCPGYFPHTDSAKESLKEILKYNNGGNKVKFTTPNFVKSLNSAKKLSNIDIIYWQKEKSQKSNDNSTIKLFRRGYFTILSCGDIESKDISEKIIQGNIISSEVDIMILAHHGADNGFTSSELLDAIKPTVAICTSDYDSQFNHPKDEIREILFDRNIPLFTTKTGDVIIESLSNDNSQYQVINLIANSSDISSKKIFRAKTY